MCAVKRRDSAGELPRLTDVLAPSLAEDWPAMSVDRAEGSYLQTSDGRRILDFTSGIGVTNTGHGHPRVVKSAKAQVERMIHSAVGITMHEPLLVLTRELRTVMPEGMEMFFFGNSGAEAVEGALKLARYVRKRPVIVAFLGGFHGRTYGAASVTTVKSRYRLNYEPFVGSVYFVPFADPYHGVGGAFGESSAEAALGALRQLFDRVVAPDQVAALLVEPIQGENGYIIPPAGFLEGLRRICDETGILLVFDEVQTGFGRTGSMFAAQTFGVRPDVMAVGKAIASGFPLSATVASRDLMGQWTAGSHGTTFGGNPVSCAAAVATLDVIREERLLENARHQGSRLLAGLSALKEGFEAIGDVRGRGLMLAMEFVESRTSRAPDGALARRFLESCLSRGLLLYMAGASGQVVRLIPPLTVDSTQIEEALGIMAESLNDSTSGA